MKKYKRYIFLIVSVILFGAALTFLLLESDLGQSGLMIFLATATLATVILVVAAVILIVNHDNRNKIKNLQNRLSMWAKLSYHISEVGDEVFNDLPVGIIVTDDNLEIKWTNPYMSGLWPRKIVGVNLREVNEFLQEKVASGTPYFMLDVNGHKYDCWYRRENQAIYFFDVTDRETIKSKYNDRKLALGIINLDNLDETLANLDVSEQSSIKGEYLSAIDDWISNYKGFLKPLTDERLMIAISRESLDEMMQRKFDILEVVRNISEKNNIKVSLSIGVACWDISYEELGSYAQNAIELAEKRGGDQAVINIENQKIAYFGAKTNALVKSSRVSSRVNAQTFREYIEKASNVIVMGHRNTDLDSFGSMIATAKMALAYNAKTNLLIDVEKLDSTVSKVYEEYISKRPNITKNMLTTEEALRVIDDETILVILDTPTPKLASSQEVLEATKKIIVIDHHRSSEDGFQTVMSYVEPYASSTIELLLEIMNFMNKEPQIDSYEATIMYGGLVVDTNNFTYKTGSRTFEGASKLKELGAETATVKRWLRRDLERTNAINRLLLDVEVYLDIFAIVKTNELVEDTILLAQVSEELMQINGIEAAFTIASIAKDRVGISARSYQDINVQVMMELFGGGGHLNSAATQIKDTNPDEVYDKLKEQLELEYSGGGTNMRVILIEDVKGRGKKDDVIEVANGYAQFLMNSKKAILATDDNLAKLEAAFVQKKAQEEHHLELMRELRDEINNKTVKISIMVGPDGKLFGSVTVKQIVEEFYEQNGILIDRKKVELTSEVNSLGIYTAIINLYKDIKAQIEVHVVEK